MEQISQNITTKFRDTVGDYIIDAVKRIYDGRYTISASVKKSDKVVASLVIDEKYESVSVNMPLDVVKNDTEAIETIKTNIFNWTHDLINEQ